MTENQSLKDTAPFSQADLIQTVKTLRKYRSLMWAQAQRDNKQDYAEQFYEVVRTLIYGIYFTWEKYKYERGWISGIAEEGESMMQYDMFQIGVVDRIKGLLEACKQQNIFDMFPGGKETNDMIIKIYGDLLLNIRKGAVRLDKYNLQPLH